MLQTQERTTVVSRISAAFCLLLVAALISACGGTQSAAPTNAPAAAAPTTAAAPTEAPAAPTEAAAAAPTAAAPTAAAGGAAAGTADQGACTSEAASKETSTDKARLVIGTGGTGGVFFPYGGGLARIITEKLPNAEATAEVTGGSVDNMKLIQTGDADIGLSTVDSAYDAIKGQGAYADVGPIPACAIAVLYQSYVHVIALESSGIKSVPDMKGKRISVGSAGSSTEGAADRVLEAAGLDPKADITRDNLSVAESAAAMKDQKIDAFFWIGGLPTSAVTDLAKTPNTTLVYIPTDEYIAQMVEKYGPLYTPFTLTNGIYDGMAGDVPGIGIGNILFVNANMSEQMVYDLLKTIFDNLAEVQGVHPEAKKLSLETAATGSSIPFHPGAIKFYQEKGVWK